MDAGGGRGRRDAAEVTRTAHVHISGMLRGRSSLAVAVYQRAADSCFNDVVNGNFLICNRDNFVKRP